MADDLDAAVLRHLAGLGAFHIAAALDRRSMITEPGRIEATIASEISLVPGAPESARW